VVAKATVHSREMYSDSSLLADLNFQSVSGLYKNFTRMSPSEFEFLINATGENISKKDTGFGKAIYVQESLALTLRFLASGDS
jgi:predicted phosphoribosyltransferase